jgi:uncharacterized membrane protein YhaH (DUF805 family)
MKGNIIGFDPDTNTGAISGHDGNRYDFVMLDWRAAGRPRKGDLVDFQAIDQRATEIQLIEPQYVTPSFGQFYFSPYGRISRSQLWLRWILPYLGIVLVLDVIQIVAGQTSVPGVIASIILGIFSLVAIWPAIAIQVKRVHDRNKSGWFVLYYYVPATLFFILVFAWIGSAIVGISSGEDAAAAFGSLGVLGILVILLGVAVTGIAIWFFVEFGCLRGTVGANRFGPDPVR